MVCLGWRPWGRVLDFFFSYLFRSTGRCEAFGFMSKIGLISCIIVEIERASIDYLIRSLILLGEYCIAMLVILKMHKSV